MAITSHTCVNAKKVKEIIKAAASLNTSSEVFEELHDSIGLLLGHAIENAKNEGRRTVMGRDIKYAMKKIAGA